jgi:sugar lactone lactonase YvrE
MVQKQGCLLLLHGLAAFQLAVAQPITTILGGNQPGEVPASSYFVGPISNMVTAPNGNIYFIDQGIVREYDALRKTVRRFAGGGRNGFIGNHTLATSYALPFSTLGVPYGLAVCPNADVYFSNGVGDAIYKVNARDGILSVAMAPTQRGFNGDGIDARVAWSDLSGNFKGVGLACDATSSLLFTDNGNHRVRKIDAQTGLVTTVAGNGRTGQRADGGLATASSIENPQSIALDATGNLYILEANGTYLRKVSAGGVLTTVVGPGVGAPTSTGSLGQPNLRLAPASRIAADADGNLVVSDGFSNVRLIDVRAGTMTMLLERGGRGVYAGDGANVTGVRLGGSVAIGFDSDGKVLVADHALGRIISVDTATRRVATLFGNGIGSYGGTSGFPATVGTLGDPTGVAVDSLGNLFVTNSLGGFIHRLGNGSRFAFKVIGGGQGATNPTTPVPTSAFTPDEPAGIAVDAKGDVYISDARRHLIYKADLHARTVQTVAGSGVAGFSGDNGRALDASLNRPYGVAVGLNGALYFADVNNHRVRRVLDGQITTIAGTGSSGAGPDGVAATSSALSFPHGVAVDSSNNVYIADMNNGRVRVVSALDGRIRTLASGYRGAQLIAAPLSGNAIFPTGPSGIALDSQRNVYFSADSKVHRIDASTGQVTVVAGAGTSLDEGVDASQSALASPIGLAVGADGTIYIAAASGGRIQKIAGASPDFGPSYQGMWWNRQENGWGINFTHQGNTIFATWFTYGDGNRAAWMTGTATKAGDVFSGTLYRLRGPVFHSSPFSPTAVTTQPVGTFSLRFANGSANGSANASSAEFVFTVDGVTVRKMIEPFEFGERPTCKFVPASTLRQSTNMLDMWWAAPAGSESGWGINFAHHGDTIFATWFTYGPDNEPRWVVATLNRQQNGRFEGDLYRSTGTPFLVQPYDVRAHTSSVAGTLSVGFSDGDHGTMRYEWDGVQSSVALTRFVFGGTRTICNQ